MITAIVLYEMPDSITREQCLAHYRKIAPGFLDAEVAPAVARIREP